MTEDEMFERLAQDVSTFVRQAVGAAATRLEAQHNLLRTELAQAGVQALELKTALDALARQPGPAGKDGAPGVNGKDGIAGQDGGVGPKGERGDVGPAGRDGKDGAPGERGEKGDPGAAGRDGAPGATGEKGADGINGRDGAPGERGEKGDHGADGRSVTIDDVRPIIEAQVERGLAEVERRCTATMQRLFDALPKPRRGPPGADGMDGKDGLNIEDFDVQLGDDDQTLVLQLRQADRTITRSVRLPIMVYREVWAAGAYNKGSNVTWGGSIWIAVRDTTEAPGPGCSDWKLAVKRGRDGKGS
jgi:integrin beta 3